MRQEGCFGAYTLEGNRSISVGGTLRRLATYWAYYLAAAVLFGLYLTSLPGYLVFHTLTELVAIAVATSAFTIAWNGQRLYSNSYLFVVGVGFGSLAVLETVHTLVYKGMGALPHPDSTYSTQFWIASRGVLSLTLLAAPLLLGRKLRPTLTLSIYAAVTALLTCSILVWHIFPVTFIDGPGGGVTRFKTEAEYAICLTMGLGLLLLWRRHTQFDGGVLRWLSAAVVFTIAAELAFSSYGSLYSISNVVGHLLTVVAFYCFYVAIVRTALVQPLNLLSRDLKQQEEALRASEARYRGLFENMTEGFFLAELVYDESGTPVDWRYLDVNPAYELIMGLTRDPVIGHRGQELFPELDGSVREALLRVGVTREPLRLEAVLQPSGRCYQNHYFSPHPGQIAGIFTDVTARRQAEAEREKLLAEVQRQRELLDTVLAAAPVGIALLHGPEHRYLFVNPAYGVFTQGKEEAVGRTVAEMFAEIADTVVPLLDHVYQHGEPYQASDQPLRLWRNGRYEDTFISFSYTPWHGEEGQVQGIVVAAVETTESVRIRQRVEEAERARADVAERMTAEINHRMKNNLMLVSGVLEMQAVAEPPGSPVGRALRDAVARLASLSVVHEQLYDAKSGRVELKDVLQRIAEMGTRALVAEEVSVSVVGDPTYVTSRLGSTLALLANELITNALKYGAPGDSGKREIEIRVAQRRGGLSLEVWNSGNPIPESPLGKSKTGLGLSLTSSVVTEQLGGSLTLRPDRGGTAAEMVLPEVAVRVPEFAPDEGDSQAP
jgi:PAS domain S-box-containing protein